MVDAVNAARLIQEFIDLTAIDSETGDEADISATLKTKLAAIGLAIAEDHSGGNLIATLPGNHTGKSVLFNAHMDTGRPGRSIQAVLNGGCFVSRGETILGADDKSAIAAILEALRVIREKDLPHAEVQIVLTSGEESGLVGAKALNMRRITADYGFSLDGDGPVGGIIHRVRGQAVLIADIVAASKEVQAELTAITLASRVIAGLSLGRIDSETTASVIKFGGERSSAGQNDRVRILLLIQSVDNNKLKRQLQATRIIIEQRATKWGGRALVEIHWVYPGYSYKKEDPVVQFATAAIRRIDRQPCLLQKSGGSDANILSDRGLPMLNLSVGFERIHTIDEILPVAELVKASELVLALIEQGCLND